MSVCMCMNLPCMAMERSTELKLLAEYSLSVLLRRLPLRNGPVARLIRFCDKCSPHKFEPPCVYGIFNNAMPCNGGPLAKSNGTPSHCFFRCFQNGKKKPGKRLKLITRNSFTRIHGRAVKNARIKNEVEFSWVESRSLSVKHVNGLVLVTNYIRTTRTTAKKRRKNCCCPLNATRVVSP